MHHALSLGTATLHALASGALYWPSEQLLCVSDLHFGKSERMARRGGMLLPPYDTRATLGRLDADMDRTRATRIICLGDSFDDMAASEGLDEGDRLWLARLMAGRHWIWVEGNHDPGPLDVGGSHKAEVTIAGLTFRHIANPSQSFEISGHYHPKARLASQSRPCFLADAARVILPAYGTYTGGLWSDDAALTALLRPDALAIVTGQRALCIPMPR